MRPHRYLLTFFALCVYMGITGHIAANYPFAGSPAASWIILLMGGAVLLAAGIACRFGYRLSIVEDAARPLLAHMEAFSTYHRILCQATGSATLPTIGTLDQAGNHLAHVLDLPTKSGPCGPMALTEAEEVLRDMLGLEAGRNVIRRSENAQLKALCMQHERTIAELEGALRLSGRKAVA